MRVSPALLAGSVIAGLAATVLVVGGAREATGAQDPLPADLRARVEELKRAVDAAPDGVVAGAGGAPP